MSLHLRSNVIIAAVITFGLAATLGASADRSRGGSQVGETAILSHLSFPSDQRDKTPPRYVSALHAPDDSSLTLNFGSPAKRCAVADRRRGMADMDHERAAADRGAVDPFGVRPR